MKPRQITHDDLNYWQQATEGPVQPVSFGSNGGNIDPCEGINTIGELNDGQTSHPVKVVRVPWTLTEDDISELIKSKTLWFSCWGGLVPHMIEVGPATEEPEDGD